MERWKCTICGYVHEGPLPENFTCPRCKQPASVFERIEEKPATGNKYAGTKTEKNLKEAFSGESQARNKYTFFAKVAEQEGFEQIAAFYLETARNEQEHARLWFEELGGIGKTAENLISAAEGENYEWTTMYDRMAKEAEEEGFAQTEAMLKEYYEQNQGAMGDIESASTQDVLNGLIWPSDARYLTDKFGWRDAPTAGASSYHQGVDIGAPWNSNIYAAQSGTVIQAGWNGSYGYSVTIDHGYGVATLYGHMNKYWVSVGDYVSRKDVIGLCGSTGVSTGPHIHYEVRLNGEKIDPMPYLPGYIRWW